MYGTGKSELQLDSSKLRGFSKVDTGWEAGGIIIRKKPSRASEEVYKI